MSKRLRTKSLTPMDVVHTSPDETEFREYKLKKWSLDMDVVRRWKPLDADYECKQKMDCVINTMTILGAIKNRNMAEHLAHIRNVEQSGVKLPDVLFMLYYTQLNDAHYAKKTATSETYKVFKPDYDDSAFDVLRTRMDDGDAVFIVLLGNSSHASLIFKHENMLYLFDPQNNMLIKEDDIQSYFKRYGFDKYNVVLEFPKRSRVLHEIPTSIRKHKNSKTVKKQKRSRSRSRQTAKTVKSKSKSKSLTPMDIEHTSNTKDSISL